MTSKNQQSGFAKGFIYSFIWKRKPTEPKQLQSKLENWISHSLPPAVGCAPTMANSLHRNVCVQHFMRPEWKIKPFAKIGFYLNWKALTKAIHINTKKITNFHWVVIEIARSSGRLIEVKDFLFMALIKMSDWNYPY